MWKPAGRVFWGRNCIFWSSGSLAGGFLPVAQACPEAVAEAAELLRCQYQSLTLVHGRRSKNQGLQYTYLYHHIDDNKHDTNIQI